jgi:tetratricopeptide (TPR) repeat protein
LVLKANPALGDAEFNLGTLLSRIGRRAEAVAHLRRAVELMPAFDGGYLQLAQTLADEGEWAEAVLALRRGLSRAPDSLRLLNQLGWWLAASPVSDAGQAVRIADVLRAQTKEQVPEPLDMAAAAYAAAGRFDEAVAVARTAQALATQRGDAELADQIGGRRVLYENRQAYRLP